MVNKDNSIKLTSDEYHALIEGVDEFLLMDIDDGSIDEDTFSVVINQDKSVDLSVEYTGTAYHRIKL